MKDKIYVEELTIPSPDLLGIQEINAMVGMPANPSYCATGMTCEEEENADEVRHGYADLEEYNSSAMQKHKRQALLSVNVEKLMRKRPIRNSIDLNEPASLT